MIKTSKWWQTVLKFLAKIHRHSRESNLLNINIKPLSISYLVFSFIQKSTKCFDHSQLAVNAAPREEDLKDERSTINEVTDRRDDDGDSDHNVIVNTNSCNTKNCEIKKRNLSISSQIKTTHNKSETGLKQKKCAMHRKKTVKNKDVIPNIGPLAEHILMKTF